MSDIRRPPQVFDPSDPRLTATQASAPEPAGAPAGEDPSLTRQSPAIRIPTTADLQHGLRWGMILVSTAVSLFVMSLALRFWTFVWALFQRQDWIGWLALGLAGLLVLSLAMILAGEIVGFFRLSRLQRLRRQTEKAVEEMAVKQTAILQSAARLVKSGGRLVYATCSVLPQENEAIAEVFSAANPDFAPLACGDILDGLKVVEAQKLCTGGENGALYLRLWPHRHATDGFFAAVWQKK